MSRQYNRSNRKQQNRTHRNQQSSWRNQYNEVLSKTVYYHQQTIPDVGNCNDLSTLSAVRDALAKFVDLKALRYVCLGPLNLSTALKLHPLQVHLDTNLSAASIELASIGDSRVVPRALNRIMTIRSAILAPINAKWIVDMGFTPTYTKGSLCLYQRTFVARAPQMLFRALPDDLPRLSYQPQAADAKATLHWGQRKLLLSEIEFLVMHPTITQVVYAGAAPGTHILYLAKLFPKVQFDLYDPREFSPTLASTPTIHTHVQYFTDETASEWVGRENIALISDIRTGDADTMSIKELEVRVATDHAWQRSWYNIISPSAAMFKFRLPWNNEHTEYLDGQIFLQAYPPNSSTETRLIIGANAINRMYDNKKYEEQLSYFNNNTRLESFQHELSEIPQASRYGVNDAYDSAVEVYILGQYLSQINQKGDAENRVARIIAMTREISLTIAKHRTLSTPQPLKPRQRAVLQALAAQSRLPQNAPMTRITYQTYVLPHRDQLIAEGIVRE
jgi:hypothetical protein